MVDPEVIARVAESKIQEAIEEGKFDNLPGKGKPLVFEDDAGIPLHIRMANKVLKNAGGLPDWVMVQRDILSEQQELATLRARLMREGEARRQRLTNLPASHGEVSRFAEWHTRSRAGYLRKLKSVNTSILKFSMIAPSTAPSYASYKIEREMADFDAAFPTLEQAAHLAPTIAEADSKLKHLARERYKQGGGEVRGWAKAASFLGLGNAPATETLGGYEHEDTKRADVPESYKKKP